MALKTEVQILGDASSLARATKRASGDLDRFGKKTKTMGLNLKGVFAGIAAGLSVAAITDFARESVKAAIADNTAQAILASTLKKTTGATTGQIAEVEKLIATYQMQTGILDDELRPAFQTLATSTHDTTKSNELLQIAMDASVATGKPLNMVALAIGKAFNGSNTSLLKLVPSLKKAKDPIKELGDTFKGAAIEAAKKDPFKIFDTTMADVSETVGNRLLPKLQEFADYLKSPGGQQAIESWTNLLTGMATSATNVVDAFSGNPSNPIIKFLSGVSANFFTGADALIQANPLGRLGTDVANATTGGRYGQLVSKAKTAIPQNYGSKVTQNVTVNVNNNGSGTVDYKSITRAVKDGLRFYNGKIGK
jgi:hypothetical protein